MATFPVKSAVACFQVSGQNLLSPTGSSSQQRRPSSVMFSDVVLFHGGGTNGNGETTKNVCSSEKMTQTGDDHLWPALGSSGAGQQIGTQQQVSRPDIQPQFEGGEKGETKLLSCRSTFPNTRVMTLSAKGCQNS
jgi:hypothetical protein